MVNFGTMLGMAANLAKDAVTINPKKVLLNARRSLRRRWNAQLTDRSSTDA